MCDFTLLSFSSRVSFIKKSPFHFASIEQNFGEISINMSFFHRNNTTSDKRNCSFHQNNTNFYRFLIVFSITSLLTVYFCFNDILRKICLVLVLEQYIRYYFRSLFLCKSNHFQLQIKNIQHKEMHLIQTLDGKINI